MKSPRFIEIKSASINDAFEQFDAFLTGLILDRASIDARTGLGNWLNTPAKRVKTKARARKAKAALASV